MVLIEALFLVLVSPTPESAFDAMKVQEGHTKQMIAHEPLVMDPVSFCFDDQGRILVVESFRQELGVEDNRSSPFWLEDDLAAQSIEDRLAMYIHWADQREGGMDYYSKNDDRIRILTDTDGDGVVDAASVFADGFNEPLDGTAAGVLAIGGDVWFTNIPSLWKLNDTDGDGKADVRESVYRGFGVRIALRGHDMHGLALGMDGRLYWSMGDRGYHLELGNEVLHSPGEGAVFRCELDGSALTVFHHGLRNPQELAFDKYGNLFTCDNNSDAADKARVVYCVEGGETGWRMEYQTLEGENQRGPWIQENGWDPHATDRPAWILPAVDTIGSGPSGFVSYPGRGLADRYDDHFFMCDFLGGASHSSVLSFAVEPKGAGFAMVDLHPFVEGILCTDVDFGYDGRMVISDWGEGWTGNKEGRLYAVWDPDHRSEGDVSEIFKAGFYNRRSDDLRSMLSHEDRRVRIRAQFELVEREAVQQFVQTLGGSNQLARLHAMWGLATLERRGGRQMEHIVPLLGDSDPEIRAHACRILGEAKLTSAKNAVGALILDPSPRVSFFATIAVGHLGGDLKEVVSMLERNSDRDVYLRHAGVVSLANSQYQSALANLSTHPDAAVRLAVVLAMRKQKSQFIAEFLLDSDDAIATEAARAIHDAPIPQVLARLAETLPIASTMAWQRRAISASLASGKPEDCERVAQFAADSSQSERMRTVAIGVLRLWLDPPNRDIVEGRWAPVRNKASRSVEPLIKKMPILVASAQGELLTKMFQLAQVHDIPLPDGLSRNVLMDDSQPISLRAYCLRHLADDEAIEFGLDNDNWQLRAAARDVKVDQGGIGLVDGLVRAVHGSEVGEAQAAITSLGRLSEGKQILDLEDLAPELHLEYWEVPGDPNVFPDPFDGEWLVMGGSPEQGRQVVFEHSASQCLRCHTIGDQGGISGPPLDAVGSTLDDRELLEALLIPSKRIAEGFGAYSAMPSTEGLLGYREIRDVIAYLKTLQAE